MIRALIVLFLSVAANGSARRNGKLDAALGAMSGGGGGSSRGGC